MISIIAAVAENNAIGRGNELLWHIKEDLKYFKSTTLGHPVVMGRKTFASIGRPLPGRKNIVISRNGATSHLSDTERVIPTATATTTTAATAMADKRGETSVEWVQDLDTLLVTIANDSIEYFVIGGASVYKAAMKYAAKLYITKIHATAPDADAFFPAIDPAEWHIATRSPLQHNDENNLDHEFLIFTKSII